MMRTPASGLPSVMTIALSVYASAQTDRPRTGFSPPIPSEELAKQPQTPGVIGDQQRHYYFKDAGREMPYRNDIDL